MPRIPVEKLEIGMRLVRSVRNEHGMLLLDQGVEVTESILDRLENSNIKSVYVAASQDDGAKTEMFIRLDARFARTEGEPHMDAIKAAVKDHLDALYG